MPANNIVSFRIDNLIFYYSEIDSLIGKIYLLLDYSGKLVKISSSKLFEDISVYKPRIVFRYPSIISNVYKISKQINLYLEGKLESFSIPYKIELEKLQVFTLEFILNNTKYSRVYTSSDIFSLMDKKNLIEIEIIEQSVLNNPLPFVIPTHRILGIKKAESQMKLDEYLLNLEVKKGVFVF